jgi:hypothetical protein
MTVTVRDQRRSGRLPPDRRAMISSSKEQPMKLLCTLAILTSSIATPAFAQVQGVDLNGQYQCMQLCRGPQGGFAFITQYGWELNIVNDAGEPSRAWVNFPGRIWVDRANQSAIYSPDGLTIQFDGGTIWQRVLVAPAPVSPAPRRR